MNFHRFADGFRWLKVVPILATLMIAGCVSTPSVWDARVGVFSWEEALAELGEPTRVTELEGGVKSAEWLADQPVRGVSRYDGPPSRDSVAPHRDSIAQAPVPRLLQLSFTPDGKLLDWRQSY